MSRSRSFTSSTILEAHFTLGNFRSVAGSVAVRQSIGNTLLISVLAPTFCVLLGLVHRLCRPPPAGHRGGGALDYVAMFPIAVPGIVFGTGIFWTYLMTPAYGTIWILVIAFVASYIPFAYRMIDTSIIQIDKSLEEASAVCGASHWRTAREVTFKLIRPGILSAWILVFIFSVREISAAILLASPSNKVLSVMSWDYLEFGNVQNAAIIGLLQTPSCRRESSSDVMSCVSGFRRRPEDTEAMRHMARLSVEDLVVAYGSVMAVRNVSFTVEDGEFVSLLGPSGCGKTTTLRCIAGLEGSIAGTIRIGDEVVAADGPDVPPEKRGINMVFQSYAVWPHMTVFENVAYGLRTRREPRVRLQSKVRRCAEAGRPRGLRRPLRHRPQRWPAAACRLRARHRHLAAAPAI